MTSGRPEYLPLYWRWSWPDVTKHKREWMVNNLGLEDPKDVLFGPMQKINSFTVKVLTTHSSMTSHAT